MSRKLRPKKLTPVQSPAMETARRDLHGLKQCIQMQLTLLKDLEKRLNSIGDSDFPSPPIEP